MVLLLSQLMVLLLPQLRVLLLPQLRMLQLPQSMVLLLPVTSVDMFMCNSVWFGISEKLRNKEGWWDQVPLDWCLIETDAPYLGGEREDRIYSPYIGSEGLEAFCKGINVPRRMLGAILAQNFRDFYGVA